MFLLGFLKFLLPMLPGFLLKGLGYASEALKHVADAVVEDRKARRDERIAEQQAAKEIRLATAGYWEQRLLAFTAGVIAIAHWALIGLGTYLVAPHKAIGVEIGYWEWLLQIPNMPEPWASYEGPIILSYFGIYAGLTIGKQIAGAMVLRGRR